MARSSILLLHALQLYVQLLQMRLPSPSNSKFASESRRVPQVLHRKQSMCHRFPASSKALPSSSISPQPLHGYTTSSGSIGDSGYVIGESAVAIAKCAASVLGRLQARVEPGSPVQMPRGATTQAQITLWSGYVCLVVESGSLSLSSLSRRRRRRRGRRRRGRRSSSAAACLLACWLAGWLACWRPLSPRAASVLDRLLATSPAWAHLVP